MESIYSTALDALQLPASYLFNPEKRIYFLYLLTSTLLAYYVYKQSKLGYSFFKYIFNRKVWASRSALTDYGLIFINAFIKVIFIVPFLIYGLYLSYYTNEFLLNHLGYPSFKLGPRATVVAYTLSITLVGDFFSFFLHYLMHKVHFLWAFHKVHHSATSMTPITQYRLHPVELIITNIKSISIFGLLTGIFDYLSDYEVYKVLFWGVNIFAFIFMVLGANLRHSHVQLKYPPWLEYIFISPFQHQIHHSNKPSHFNKNMGSKLAVWDWLFNTLMLSRQVSKIRYGLGGKEDSKFDSLGKNMYMPFKQAYEVILRKIRKG